MRSAVSMAVPDGASTFWSWWSSMISAVSNQGAASSAKRIMSTAPMAKLGATMQLLLVNVLGQPVEVVVGEAGGARPRRGRRCRRTSARFSRAASTWVKSTATSAPACGEGVGVGRHLQAAPIGAPVTSRRSSPAWSGSTAATSSRSGSPATARHTVRPHPPAGPEHPDPDRHGPDPTPPAPAGVDS